MMPYFCVLNRRKIIKPNWLFGQASSERGKALNGEDFLLCALKQYFLVTGQFYVDF